MVVLSAFTIFSYLFTILISLSPISTPLILLSVLMKLTNTSAAILYNSLESRHLWSTNMRVKESDRKPFILILDSILVYVTLVMWINLSPYPNLCFRKDKITALEKIKSTLMILEKDFYLFLFCFVFVLFFWLFFLGFLTHQLCCK